MRKVIVTGVLAAIVWACTTCALRSASLPDVDLGPPMPAGTARSKEARSGFRVMTYNIAHGRAQSLHQALLSRDTIKANLTEIGELIAIENPDVVALQELDDPSVWSGHFDHAASLARYTGYPHIVRGHHGDGFGPVKLDYGAGLLSRLPAQRSSSHAFDTSWRDNKGFVKATVRTGVVGAEEIDVVSVHLDFMSAKARGRQLGLLARSLEPRNRPLVVMGDFNCEWDADDCVRSFAKRFGLQAPTATAGTATFPSDKPKLQLDWILISPELRFESYATLPHEHSDHLAVVADIGLARTDEAPH